VRPTFKRFFSTSAIFCLSLLGFRASAQENSPYSRYALGDLVPAQNILNRGMGGISLAYSDYQSVNFVNPASYASLKITTFDVGLDLTSRTLMTINPPKKFASANLVPSYLQLGLPLSKKHNWGMNLGLKPITRVNYDMISNVRVPGVDSIQYNYFGNGGAYQFFGGMAYGGKSLSVGFNAGYMFGSKMTATKVVFVNDTINYKPTNSTDTTHFGGMFFNAGIQYKIKLSKDVTLTLGGNANLQAKLNATRNISRQTIDYSTSTGYLTIDSVYFGSEQKGTIIYPSSWGAGFMVAKENVWLFGAEINMCKWADYRYYGNTDRMSNSWTARVGGQYLPDFKSENYWLRTAYRLGASFGPDQVMINKKIPQAMLTFGASLPVRRNPYSNQYSTINTSFEIGSRGNKNNDIKENIFRLSLGFCLSDIWFNKPKYQ
jgi:hypothetical protein